VELSQPRTAVAGTTTLPALGTAIRDLSKRLEQAQKPGAAATLLRLHSRILFLSDAVDRAIDEVHLVSGETPRELLQLRDVLT
jgi:hypothetical protein